VKLCGWGKANMATRFLAIEKLINLRDGYRKRLKIDQWDVVLLQEQGDRYVIQSHCPHQQHPLLDANVEDGVITCPYHQYRFDMNQGINLEGVCAPLRCYDTVYDGNAIGIMIDD